MERKSLVGIQLDFLLSVKWEMTGLSFRDNASDPLYRHLADSDPDAGSEGCRRSGTETKESSEDGISEKRTKSSYTWHSHFTWNSRLSEIF